MPTNNEQPAAPSRPQVTVTLSGLTVVRNDENQEEPDRDALFVVLDANQAEIGEGRSVGEAIDNMLDQLHTGSCLFLQLPVTLTFVR